MGEFTVEDSYEYYEKIHQLGISAADPVCLDFTRKKVTVFKLPKQGIEHFWQRFSKRQTMAVV